MDIPVIQQNDTETLKQTVDTCIVCYCILTRTTNLPQNVNSEAVFKKNFSKLLQKYGELQIEKGRICQNCTLYRIVHV